MTINIRVTPSMLCDLCGGRFTLEACEALCEYLSEIDDTDYYIGDLIVSFAEIGEEDADDYEEDYIVAHLSNGNCVVVQ